MRALVVLALLAGCTTASSDRDGTFVGNPGKMDVGLSGVDPDITLDMADFEAQSLHLEACDGTEALVPLGSFDALGGRDDAIEIPGGEFCRVTLLPALVDPLILAGITAAGTDFTAVIDPGQLVMPDVLRIDETELLWDLPLDGLDPAAIDALGPGAVIEANDLIALDAATVLVAESGLYEDGDADGTVSAGDTLLGKVNVDRSNDPAAYAADASGGCSCSTGRPSTTWLVLFVLLALRATRSSQGSRGSSAR